jgi:hypothetical protein
MLRNHKIILKVLFSVLLISTSLFAKKADIYVDNVVKGSYLDYYSKIVKDKIVTVSTLSYLDWAGKSYAKKHKITENDMLAKAENNAKDYAIGFARGYLKTINKNYNPKNYYLIVDHYDVHYVETDYKITTIISGNIILIKR